MDGRPVIQTPCLERRPPSGPALGRFLSADTLIPQPGNVLAWDRFSYTQNNPVRYTDPSGHMEFEECPDDEKFVPAYRGINPARRYRTVGVSLPEAKLIFLQRMSDPGNDLFATIFFGEKNTLGGPGYHPGVDFSSDSSYSSINPAFNGVVVGLYNTPQDRELGNDFGIHVIIEHDIYGIKLYSVYAHLDSTKVSFGQVVNKQSVIGTMGNTPFGSVNGSIHLHFEVRSAENVNLSVRANARVRNMDFWINNQHESLLWVDLGKYYGYSNHYPENWH